VVVRVAVLVVGETVPLLGLNVTVYVVVVLALVGVPKDLVLFVYLVVAVPAV